ncbi:MAG: hypothetical protein SVM80_06345 [Halobacteriota archaeon]|nr:hypothetical protein [Halobacteriota archaeon]
MLKEVVSRIGIVVSSIGMIYSGLMFLNLVPADLSIRFWDGGVVAMNTAGVLDIVFGSILLYITINILIKNDVNRNARVALIVCIAGMVSDWIGGLYGISALIGVISSYLIKGEA